MFNDPSRKINWLLGVKWYLHKKLIVIIIIRRRIIKKKKKKGNVLFNVTLF